MKPFINLNKKAFELSINFLVVMIISIAVFGLGITFINKIYRSAQKTQEQYFEQYERQIQDLVCDSKDLVCIPKDTIDLSKEKYPGYGIVITNVEGEQDFTMSVEFNKAYDKNNKLICDSSNEGGCCTDINRQPNKWKRYDQNKIHIKNNAVARKAIALAVSCSKPGTYIFDVKVLKQDVSIYHNPQKIYLYVP